MALNPWRLQLLCQLESLGTVRAVSRAAHVSASSVSQQLAVLEAETGAHLLERTGRRVQLTSAGTLLAARARDILDRMAEAEAELGTLAETPSGVIRVAAFQSAIHSLVMPAVAQLRQRHPALTVHVDELEPHQSVPALLRGDNDIAITTSDLVGPPRHRDLHLVPLLSDAIVVVTPSGHRIGAVERVDLADLADEDWTFDLPGSSMADLATQLCRRAGFEPRVVCRFTTYLVTLQHVESGGPIALLPELAVDRRYHVLARGLEPAAERHVTAAVRRSSVGRLSIDTVLDALRAGVSHR